MALDFWFVTYTLQKSDIFKGKKKLKKIKSRLLQNSLCLLFQIQSHGGQRKFPDGFHKKDLSYQWLNIAEMPI